MSDLSPGVDFSQPLSDVQLLALERQQLRNVVEDLGASIADVSRFGNEGARYADFAAMWAATLMVADICKLGLAGGDRRAVVVRSAGSRG